MLPFWANGSILCFDNLSPISFLAAYIIPLPFLFLEVFVGLIQAFIFSMITLVSISLHTSVHEEAH